MIKKILILVVGLLLIGGNVFAQGNLVVDGNLGVGKIGPSRKVDIALTPTTSSPTYGLYLLNDFQGTSVNPAIAGAFYYVKSTGDGSTGGAITGFMGNANYESEGSLDTLRGAVNVVNANTNIAGSTWAINSAYGNSVELRKGASNTRPVNITNYYGFYSSGNAGIGLGSISVTNARHAYYKDLPSYSGTFSNVSGLWIDQQTSGTNNYGIVLDGEGSGSDLSFGDIGGACRPRIFSNGGGIYTENSNCTQKLISPHDLETDEWIFYSKNIKTGREVRVNMEQLVRDMEKLTGNTYMIEKVLDKN